MTNERLIQISTPMYQDAGTTTLNDFIYHAKRDFECRVITLYEMGKNPIATKELDKDCVDTCKWINKTLYSSSFYDAFEYAGTKLKEFNKFPIHYFRVNPKNINFETTIFLIEAFNGMSIYPVEEVCMSANPPLTYIKDIPQWEDLFGRGEFPYMKIVVFRLGNTEYFAYSIGR